MGMAHAEAGLRDFAWQGLDYPGKLFAPLAITQAGQDARLEAAVNWPPRQVFVFYCLQRVAFVYRQPLGKGQTQRYRYLLREVQGDAVRGSAPWCRAVDVYKKWLLERMRAEGLYPIAYPEWLQEADGWLNVQLENEATFDAQKIWNRYVAARDYFNWVQFWGQMSNYAGPPGRAVPAVKAGEQTGCCLEQLRLHDRYLPELPRLVQQIAREGRAGFYARPREPYGRLDESQSDGQGLTNWDFLREWLSTLKTYGANAFYIDVLGYRYFGEPLEIARLLRDHVSPGTVIEGRVDVYPAAFLISGCLFDDPNATMSRELEAATQPGRTAALRFPRFGRYLLEDRVVFLGESNSDHRGWGSEHDYETERQAFMLGAKLDAMHLTEGQGATARVNRVLDTVVRERRRVGWWARRPVYRDREGVWDIPAGLDVRRFRAADGETLLVFDNWQRRPNQYVVVDGTEVPAPDDALAIRTLPNRTAADHP